MKVKALLMALGVIVLAACGNLGGLSPDQQTQLSGVLSLNEGRLSLGATSVDASSAQITVDGEPATASVLQPGVVISGSGSRQADRLRLREVEVQYRVRGAVDNVNAAQGSLEVLGLKVQVNAMTYLYEENPDDTYTRLTLDDLRAGDYVKVAGIPQSDDSILATRIERKPVGSTHPDYNKVALRVRVRDLNTAAFAFTYGLKTYQVSYAGVTVQGSLSEGALVEVKGVRSGTTIQASKVKVHRDVSGPSTPGAKLELKGPLTQLDETAKTFKLLDYTVNYANARVKGVLREGAWVEAEGALENGVLMAYEVEIKYSHGGSGVYTGEIEGPLSAVDAAALTLTVHNQTFWTDANTLVKVGDAQGQFGDLRVGDWLEVKFDTGRSNSAGQPYAVKVEVKRRGSTSNQNVELEGSIAQFDSTARTFQVNGVGVQVTASTRYEIRDALVSADTFFGTNRNGARVEVKGILSASGLEASKIELK